MDSITISFSGITFNVSLQVGDVAFFQDSGGAVYMMGSITNIVEGVSITCNIPNTTPRPLINDFIFFVKDEEINKTGLAGHYGIATLECTPGPGENPEVYAISTEVNLSS